MTTTTPDIEHATISTDISTVMVIDKDNSFDLDLVYGGQTGSEPQRYDINQLTTQYDWKQPYTVWMTYGECDPIWLQELLTSITEDSKIILIDACPAGTYALDKCACDTLRPYIEKDQLRIIATGAPEQQAAKFVDLLDIQLMDQWHPVIPTNVLKDHTENLKILINTIAAKLNSKILLKNTLQVTSQKFLKNALINAPLAYKKSPLAEIKKYPSKNPVLIVAAGPSLNKQLSILKENQNLFTILAVDTVWPILNSHGIHPDIVFGVDSRSRPSWPVNGIHSHTQLVVDIGCSPELVWSHNANHAFTYANGLIQKCLDRLGCHSDFLETGGSVSTSAFDLAIRMKANPIVLIGQDLALTGGKDHAEGYPHAYTSQMLEERSEAGFDVEGYYPEKVRTERALMMYKSWFEQRINQIPEITVINATEGGARIFGTFQLPFLQVCEEIKNANLSKEPYPMHEPTRINPEHMKNLIHELKLIINEIESLKKIADAGLKYCKKSSSKDKKISIKSIDLLNQKIKNSNKSTKFFLEVFSLHHLEQVTKNADRIGEKMTLSNEIEMYENIYSNMKKSSTAALEMLNEISGFYQELEETTEIDISLIKRFITPA